MGVRRPRRNHDEVLVGRRRRCRSRARLVKCQLRLPKHQGPFLRPWPGAFGRHKAAERVRPLWYVRKRLAVDPRTVTTTATPAFPRMGARTRPLRATPRPTTAKANACALIAAAPGCFPRGCCDRPHAKGIPPTIAMRSGIPRREDAALTTAAH